MDDTPMEIASLDSAAATTVVYERPPSSLEPVNTCELITNWTEYANGGSPHYCGGPPAPDDPFDGIRLATGSFPDTLGQPSHAVDRLAHSFLMAGLVSFDDIRLLVEELRGYHTAGARSRKRVNSEDAEAFAFHTGAYVHGGDAGLLTETLLFPWVTVLLTSLVSSVVPGHTFSTVVLSHDVQTAVHKDIHNHRAVDNAIIPLSKWSTGGGIWLREEAGLDLLNGEPGNIHPIGKYLLFDATKEHATQPWQGGHRTVLISYHIRDGWRVSDSRQGMLRSLGFMFWSGCVRQDPYM